MLDNHVAKTDKLAAWISKKLKGLKPTVAVIMGSGLSGAVPEMDDAVTIPYGDIPGFLKSTVQGHAGTLVVGTHNGVVIAFMKGRFHYYEGHAMHDLALPIRMLHKLGVKHLVVTAAVGSVKKNIKPGSVVILNDHMNFMGANPLRGVHDDSFGAMFPDMTEPYDAALRKATVSICRKRKIPHAEGVYVASMGPSYETPAEVKAFAMLGGTVVGMSTVPEVIAARQLRMKVLGLSWVTNLASGVSDLALTHEEVLEVGKESAKRMKVMLDDLTASAAFRG